MADKSIGSLSYQISANADPLLGAFNQIAAGLKAVSAMMGRLNEAAGLDRVAADALKAADGMNKVAAATDAARTGWEKFVQSRAATARSAAAQAETSLGRSDAGMSAALAQMAENRKMLAGMPFVGPMSRGVSLTGQALGQRVAGGAGMGLPSVFPFGLPPTAYEQQNRISGRGLPLLQEETDLARVQELLRRKREMQRRIGKESGDFERDRQRTAAEQARQAQATRAAEYAAYFQTLGPTGQQAQLPGLGARLGYDLTRPGVKAFGGALGGHVASAAGLGGIAYAGGPAAMIAAGLSEAVGQGATFEKTMARVQALSNASAADIRRLGDEAKLLGAKTEFGGQGAAEALQVMAQAGFKTKDMLDALKPTLAMASAGMISVERAADLATSAQREFGLQTTDMARIADVFAFASSNAKTTMDQLGDSMKFAAPIANAAGMSIEQTSSALMMLANAGIRGTEAGTVVRNMLKKTADQSAEAREIMELYGISFQDAQGNFIGFGRALDQLSEKFKGLGKQTKIELLSKIFEIRASQGFISLLDKGKEFDSLMKQMGEDAPGTAERMQATQLNTTWGKFTTTVNEVKNVFISVFDTIKPIVDGLIDAFGGFFKIVKEGFAALAPLLNGVARVLGGILDGVGALFSGISGFVEGGIKGWTELFKAMKGTPEGQQQMLDSLKAHPVLGTLFSEPQSAPAGGGEGGGMGPLGSLFKGIQSGYTSLTGYLGTRALDINKVLKLDKEVNEAQTSMTKHTAAAKEAYEAGHRLLEIGAKGGDFTAETWEKAREATKEYAGQLAELERRFKEAEAAGAGGEILDSLREKIRGIKLDMDLARQFKFRELMDAEALSAVKTARSAVDEYGLSVERLNKLQAAGLISGKVYGENLRKITEEAASKSGIMGLLDPMEKFNVEMDQIKHKMLTGQLDEKFGARALFGAASGFDALALKSQGPALLRGSSEAISAVNQAFQEKPGENLARQVMEQIKQEIANQGAEAKTAREKQIELLNKIADGINIKGDRLK